VIGKPEVIKTEERKKRIKAFPSFHLRASRRLIVLLLRMSRALALHARKSLGRLQLEVSGVHSSDRYWTTDSFAGRLSKNYLKVDNYTLPTE